MAAPIRRADGFVRYAFSIQYHGASFLGFSDQGNREDRVLEDGTDLRGYRSVEGRVREALASFVGADNFENVQVSSRTDRGVHALKNTFHVDLRHSLNLRSDDKAHTTMRKALNFHLARQETYWDRHHRARKRYRNDLSTYRNLGHDWTRHSISQECRILNCVRPPQVMDNTAYQNLHAHQPPIVDWNARFSATRRAYIYRIWNADDWGAPFEWDRSWHMQRVLDVAAMQQAARYLVGTHDFTSFRAAHCQRSDAIVTMQQIAVHSQPCGVVSAFDDVNEPGGLLGLGVTSDANPRLITIRIVGNSFLYRQVRNMVGCLVDVGAGRLKPEDMRHILEAKDRQAASITAPPQGLFLADVQHGDLVL